MVGFPHGSVVKNPSANPGASGLIPGLGRSSGGSQRLWASPMAQQVKNPPAMQETQEIQVRSLGQEDSLEKENGTPLQYSCLGNPMDRGAWRATVREITKEWDMT